MDTDFPLLLVTDNLAFPNLNLFYQLQKNVAVKRFYVLVLPDGFKPQLYVALFFPPIRFVLANQAGANIFGDSAFYLVLIKTLYQPFQLVAAVLGGRNIRLCRFWSNCRTYRKCTLPQFDSCAYAFPADTAWRNHNPNICLTIGAVFSSTINLWWSFGSLRYPNGTQQPIYFPVLKVDCFTAFILLLVNGFSIKDFAPLAIAISEQPDALIAINGICRYILQKSRPLPSGNPMSLIIRSNVLEFNEPTASRRSIQAVILY